METPKFPLTIEIISGEPFISVQDLIASLEGSMSQKGTQFDFALFTLASQLKELKNRAINLPSEGEPHAPEKNL